MYLSGFWTAQKASILKKLNISLFTVTLDYSRDASVIRGNYS